MFEEALNTNRNKYNEHTRNASTFSYDLVMILIWVNPFYNWVEKNVNNLSYKLMKGCITNIVPFGAAGREYFEKIAEAKVGFTKELIGLYNKLEKMHAEGTLVMKSYLQLQYLGYTGEFLGGKYPVDDVIKYMNQ